MQNLPVRKHTRIRPKIEAVIPEIPTKPNEKIQTIIISYPFKMFSLHIGSITQFVRLAKRWRNLIIIPSFQYSEHTMESYCHCASFSVYVIHLKHKQQ